MPFTTFTDKDFKYKYYPTHTQAARFAIKTLKDAYIALTDDPNADAPTYVIRLGENSAISKNGTLVAKSNKAIKFNSNGFSDFWITWYNQRIRVGQENSSFAILKCEDKELNGDFFGVATEGANGEWSIDDRWTGWLNDPTMNKAGWLHDTKGHVPPGATIGGYDGLTQLYYVARTYEGSRHVPGKYRPDTNEIEYIGNDLTPKKSRDFEILVGGNMLTWTVASNGESPPTAVNGGETSSGESIHIGRAPTEFAVEMGSVLKSEKALLVVQNGVVKRISTYEVCCVEEGALPD